ncbi:mediator complex subunit Med7 [Rhizoctonia solani]|uniref:Mediator of RNA polymerase II transcription subunit 7 n=1 Tax=Rhizoctonia solani TaxID=456999 RepID=A0A8H7LMM3_9AGAM
MDEPGEIQSTFPTPPAHYVRYTSSNLQLLSQLKTKLGSDAPSYHPASDDLPYPDVQAIRQQHNLLSDARGVPDWDLLELQPPRVDWIVEEGGYSTFGEQWSIPERQPTVEEIGVRQLYPADPNVDRRPYLQQLLHTLLHNHFEMLGALLEAPPIPTQADPEPTPAWLRLTEWTEIAGVNMIMAVNDLRSLQARATLEGMMETQVRNRRDDARAINERCDAIEAMLGKLKDQSLEYKTLLEGESDYTLIEKQPTKTSTDVPIVSQNDLMEWAEDVKPASK